MAQNRRHSQSIQPCGHIIEYDAPTLGKVLQLADRKGLGDIEGAKEEQCSQAVPPVGRRKEKSDGLAGYFVDDDKAGIVAAGLARDDGGRGDT